MSIRATFDLDYVVGQCGHAFMTVTIPKGFDLTGNTKLVCEVLVAAFGRTLRTWHDQRMELRLTVNVTREASTTADSDRNLISAYVTMAASREGIPCLIPYVH